MFDPHQAESRGIHKLEIKMKQVVFVVVAVVVVVDYQDGSGC